MPSSSHSTAVIVTYNSMTTIDRTLSAAQPCVEAGELVVIIVDNASSDGTAEHVRQNYPWVTVIDHGDNYGFARGCNRGFELVRTPYTLFLNPDAELKRDDLETLRHFMEGRPECGVAGPAIIYPGEHLQLAGMMATPMSVIKNVTYGKALPTQRCIEPNGEPFETNWLCGAVVLIRSDLYREAGMMDPRYFMYFEETDLWRVVKSLDYEIWAVGTAIAHHEGGTSARASGYLTNGGFITRHYYRSRFYYLSKNFGTPAALITESAALAMLALRYSFRAITGKERPPLRARLAGGLFRKPKAP